MAEVSTLNVEERRITNESTPPNKIVNLPVPKAWIKPAPHVMDTTVFLSDNRDNTSLYGNGEGQASNENSDELKEKSEGSYSLSSNGYASNSCLNDSSIMNASVDDQPDSSTPQHATVANSKYKMYRPPDLVIEEAHSEEHHNDFMDLDQYSPVRSPYPANSSNDSLFGHETPQPMYYDTPPKGPQMNEKDMKLVHLLTRFGLGHHAFIFIEQEVDIGLFLTLNDEDLQEIGIRRNTDRNLILSVIEECNNRLYGYKNENSD